MLKYERGSEWRRWDLHIHTPGTIRNDQYEGSTKEEKWENFYNSIISYVGEGNNPLKTIAVIGITDYLSIDNYKKVIVDKRLPDSVKLVLPNVELRMVPFAKSSPVNIHCIFDPDIVESLEGRFFSKLRFDFRGSSYGALRGELIRLGRDFMDNQSLPEEEAYIIGNKQFVLEFSSLKKIFESDIELRDHCIVVVSNRSGDGATGVVNHAAHFICDESQMEATRRSIYQFADMIFSSNESDIKYFVGDSVDDPSTVKKKCGSLKPCIHGSDAHSCAKLFEPEGKRFCWIKADPTFNGLRQVLYEPKDRVRISPIRPETKPDYQVIDRVEIIDKDFSSNPICFNDRLTCIIGGKSTGKSLLLHNMASIIDPDQVKDKSEVTGCTSKSIKGIKVFWKDGAISQDGSDAQAHKIVYIPQTYLNRLSDEHEELTEIDEIIHDIVMISSDAKKSFDEMKRNLASQKSEIDRKIYSLIQQYNEWQGLIDTLSEIGTRSGIEKEIKKIKEEKDKLSKELSISDEDIAIYDESMKSISKLKGNVIFNNKNIETILAIDSLVTLVEIDKDLPEDLLEEIKKSAEQAVKAANNVWHKNQSAIIKRLEEEMQDFQNQLENKSKSIEPLAAKITESEAIKELSGYLQAEEEKLLRFSDLEDQAKKSKEKCDGLLKQLTCSFMQYRNTHQLYADFINNSTDLSTEDLEFSVETPFRSEAFVDVIKENFDKRTDIKKFIDLDVFSEAWITENNVSNLIDAIIRGKIRLTKNRTPENVLREVLGDWYNSAYRVSMDGDLIDEMSPGKKALVLLKMLISLAESTCPILVDQPEDDLDNRSIFDELIPFLKKKKLTRQIIVVTHNANVVLGADADEIIVANQEGKNSPNKEFRFEYRSGAIEDDMPEEMGRTDTLGKQGIQQQICDILEGGKMAFDLRKSKYRM